jgi:hypothetical protein
MTEEMIANEVSLLLPDLTAITPLPLLILYSSSQQKKLSGMEKIKRDNLVLLSQVGSTTSL